MAGPGRGFGHGGLGGGQRVGASTPGGASGSRTSGNGNKNKAPMTINMFTGQPEQLKPNAPNPFTQKEGTPLTSKGKTSASGNKPGEDAQAIAQASRKSLSPVQEAVIESRRQANLQSNGLDVAQTILGVMPAPGMGLAFGLGRKMSKMSEDDALAHPERFTTIPGDPGAIKSITGPLTSNRALPAPSAKKTNASTDESLKKKRTTLKTVLGNVPSPLGAAVGTKENPAKI